MNNIYIDKISIHQHVIKIHYHVDDNLKVFFNPNIKCFEIEYSCNIESVPTSIAVIPFVTNVLPIVWLTNSTLTIPELDKTFFDSIPGIKKGYVEMSPMLSFNGNIIVHKIVDNTYPTEKNAAFFSGGLDAFTTLIAHIKETPILITIFGADLKLNDKTGIERVQTHTESTIKQFNLPLGLYIKTNFREFINEQQLTQLIKKSKDGWWHGYQCGIGLIGHAAPLAYIHHLKTIYIASSNTQENEIICASAPSIDNQVKFGNTNIWHDQYELNRQEKTRLITNYCSNYEQQISLRVCWQSSGGSNCCQCEKCTRTMMGLLAEGVDPQKYGFDQYTSNFHFNKNQIVKYIKDLPKCVKFEWRNIQNRFIETSRYKNDSNINWIYRINVYKEHSFIYKFLRKINRLRLHIYYKIKNIHG